MDVTQNGNPVIFTYPDGVKATQGRYVELDTAIDLRNQLGTNAVEALMDDAEEQVKSCI